MCRRVGLTSILIRGIHVVGAVRAWCSTLSIPNPNPWLQLARAHWGTDPAAPRANRLPPCWIDDMLEASRVPGTSAPGSHAPSSLPSNDRKLMDPRRTPTASQKVDRQPCEPRWDRREQVPTPRKHYVTAALSTNARRQRRYNHVASNAQTSSFCIKPTLSHQLAPVRRSAHRIPRRPTHLIGFCNSLFAVSRHPS